MSNELMSAVRKNPSIVLDPRTKLFVLLMLTIFMLGGVGGMAADYLVPLLACIPFFMFLSAKRWKDGIMYMTIYLIGELVQIIWLPEIKGGLSYCIIMISGLIAHFLPVIMMGYFIVYTTTVSEFVAAMERMHVPDKITIPLSVMFRFFPTVREELDAINDAMRMRGISFSSGNIIGMLEYRFIPMMMCSVKIGEELSAAALTRGLGAEIKRTNICKIGFHLWDYIVFAICICMIVGCIILNITKVG